MTETPLVGLTSRPAGSATGGPSVRLSAPPVAIVDDDAASRLMVDLSLTRLGLMNPRLVCCDGGQAMDELARRAPLGWPHVPALMLLDAEMPVASGLDVLRWMRATPGLESVPVVVLSADESTQGVRQAYALGAVSYLVKPLGFEALGAVVRDLALPWTLA